VSFFFVFGKVDFLGWFTHWVFGLRAPECQPCCELPSSALPQFNKMAVKYHEGEMQPQTHSWENQVEFPHPIRAYIRVPYWHCLTDSSQQQQQQVKKLAQG